jgi:hypothetical protein
MPLTLSLAASTEWSTRCGAVWQSCGRGIVGCGAVRRAQARRSNGDGGAALALLLHAR